ncbi:transmembrane serine/threonine-protein kinase [Mycobacteroides abscessus subsp. abscessus]|nr:transmembrane serine/threonine-protein kinase [Mycobacteroides abscessus subsp. abscessus]
MFATILVGAGIGIGASLVAKRSRGGNESGTQTPAPQASYTRLTSAIPTAEPKKPRSTDPSDTPAPSGSDKPTPTGQPGPVPKSAAGGLLLAPAAINTIMGATDMISGTQMDAPFSSLRFRPKECGGLYTPGEDSTYRWGSQHYTALSLQGVHEDTQPRQHLVVQSVATYQDAATAQLFKSTQEAAWTNCANQTITVRFDDGKSEKAVAGTPGTDQDVLTQTLTNPYAGEGMTCQRAISTKSNVVIDVRACSKNITDQAVQLVRAIAEKIT